GEIIDLGADKSTVAALKENVKNIDDAVKSLGNAAKERLDLATRHQRLYEELRTHQAAFVAAANPAMMAAQANINAILTSANLSTDDATEAARAVELLGNAVSSTNVVAADMMAALSAPTSDALEQISASLDAAKKRAMSSLEALPDRRSTADIKAAAQKLLPLADGKDGVFKVRQRELDSIDYGQLILDEFRKLNTGLGISVRQLVEGVQTETEASSSQARQTIAISTQVMMVLGALTLIGSILFVWLYVGRNILWRISELQRAMKLLSNGDLETEIARGRHHDEIAVMADSLEVFRENMIRARTLGADRERDQLGRAEHASRMEARIADFEASVRGALERVQ
ncbi:MAG: methyl-accepting chemotaxis protein, partial [Rhizobiales bacterium]|nr:methyl-accepting chemotaxis protein [Hyphomicrobiales bacterium]